MQPSRAGHTWRLLIDGLTVSRLLFAALFPFLDDSGRLMLVVAAAGTDGLDGWLARRVGSTSEWGNLLDAACDKVFAVTALVTLVALGRLELWELLLLSARDVVSIAGAAWLAAARGVPALRDMSHRWLGKATTLAVFVVLLVLLIWPAAESAHGIVVGLAGAVSVAAGVDYFAYFRSTGQRAA